MKRISWLLLTAILLLYIEIAGIESLPAATEDQPDLTELSIEELMQVKVETVYGASKYLQKVTEAPSSVSVVTADEIKKYGYRTLADLLRSLRSFFITSDRNYSYVSVRGFGRTGDYNSRVLILVDGHRINDNIYDSILIENGFILDIDLIERVEVIRGPGSSLYGNNAFFAVINIITRSGSDLNHGEASGSAGSFGTYNGRLSAGGRFENGLDIIASGSILDSKGQNLFFREFDNPATNNGVAKDCDIERNYSLFSKFSLHDFTLAAAYVSRTKGIPTASFGTDFNDPRNRTTDKQGYIDLKYDHYFEGDLRIIARLFYDIYKSDGGYVYSGVVNKDLADGEWYGGELIFNKTLIGKHKLTLGLEYQINAKQNQANHDEDPFKIYLDDKRNSWRWAAYFQDEFKIIRNLIFNAGIRYDHYRTFGGTINPRLALIYQPLEKTIFKLIYGTAFRTPNVFELYYSVFPEKGNPDLNPEKIETWELIYEQYLGHNLVLTVAGFRNKVRDLIEARVDPADGLLVFENVAGAESKGLELELDGKWDNGLTSRISYTFQRATDTGTGKPLINSPEHMVKLNLIVPLVRGKVFAGIEEQYTSPRKTLAGNEANDFFITNLTLFSQKIIKGLEASASVYNLLDKKYGDPGSTEHIQDVIEQDGRNFRFKVTYRF